MKITKLILRSVTQYIGHSTSIDGAKHNIQFDAVRQVFFCRQQSRYPLCLCS